jgi:hypothetical protein
MKNWIKGIIIILCILVVPSLLSLLIKKEPESKPVDQGVVAKIKKPVDMSNWIEYSNDTLGFSIKIPPESYGMYRCSPRKAISVPIKIYEDIPNNAVYIAEEYYYSADDYGTDNEGECKKTIQSVELFKEEVEESKDNGYFNIKPRLGWKMIINNIKEEGDILKYVKENFGTGCITQNKLLKESGNYEIYLTGDGKKEESDPWWGDCYLNFAYKIIYSPDKQKMMSVVLGQEGTFQTNPEESSTYQYYEDEMLKSFKFN